MKTEQEMYKLITKIAENDERIRAVYVHGSRANPNAVVDNYSDYDIVFVVTDINSFIQDTGWINIFGAVTFVIESLKNPNKFLMRELNDLSRRYTWGLILADGNRLDLIIEIKEEAMKSRYIDNKPTIRLLDKDGCLPEITSLPLNNENEFIKKPCEDNYTACCTGFWFFLNDIAKAVARDQLPYAKEQFNALIRLTLNQMVNWHIGIQNNFSVSTGANGRFFKKYLSEDDYNLYAKTYSDISSENFWSAIFSTCDLFNKVANNVAEYFDFVYNKQEENSIRDYLLKVKNGIL
jgi:aminoglycoside 6-adenylyltransferase